MKYIYYTYYISNSKIWKHGFQDGFFHGYHEQLSLPYFSKKQNIAFCSDINGLMKAFKIVYDPLEWQLFIDSSKTSLMAVLLQFRKDLVPILG